MATLGCLADSKWAHEPRRECDMSHFSDGQLQQAGNALAAADWSTEDLTLLGQAGGDRLVGACGSLPRGGGSSSDAVGGREAFWTSACRSSSGSAPGWCGAGAISTTTGTRSTRLSVVSSAPGFEHCGLFDTLPFALALASTTCVWMVQNNASFTHK